MPRCQPATIDTHPQKAQILDMLMSGVSCREVAKVAGISHTAVSNYKRKVVKPAMQTAVKLRSIQDVQPESVQVVRQAAELTRSVVAAQPILARLEKLDSDRERIKGLAESKEDYKSWASLDRNDISATELQAKLTGALAGEATHQQVIIVIPGNQAPPQPIPEVDVIDIEPAH